MKKKKKKYVSEETHPAGEGCVAVSGEAWLGSLSVQLLTPHADIFKNCR